MKTPRRMLVVAASSALAVGIASFLVVEHGGGPGPRDHLASQGRSERHIPPTSRSGASEPLEAVEGPPGQTVVRRTWTPTPAGPTHGAARTPGSEDPVETAFGTGVIPAYDSHGPMVPVMVNPGLPSTAEYLRQMVRAGLIDPALASAGLDDASGVAAAGSAIRDQDPGAMSQDSRPQMADAGSNSNEPGPQAPPAQPLPATRRLRDGVLLLKPGWTLGDPLTPDMFTNGAFTVTNVSGGDYSIEFNSVSGGTVHIDGLPWPAGIPYPVTTKVGVTISGPVHLLLIPHGSPLPSMAAPVGTG